MGLIRPDIRPHAPAIMRFAHQTYAFSELGATMHSGSLICELATGDLGQKKQTVLSAEINTGIVQEISLSLSAPENKIEFASRYANHQFVLPLGKIPLENTAKLRITYSWDRFENVSLLTAEDLDSGLLYQAEVTGVSPISSLLLGQVLEAGSCTHISKAVSFIGVSGRKEPIGPSLAIAHGAMIQTPIGQVPIQALKQGDMVQTLDNGVQPVRWIGARTVPSLGGYCPIQLRAPYHNLERNLFISPTQHILVQNTNVEYLFGEESVLVEARHMLDKVSAIRQPNAGRSHTLYHILFDTHEIISVNGCNMESLFIGNIGNTPDFLKTTVLAGIEPKSLPCHTQKARPYLKPYEAAILKSEMLH